MFLKVVGRIWQRFSHACKAGIQLDEQTLDKQLWANRLGQAGPLRGGACCVDVLHGGYLLLEIETMGFKPEAPVSPGYSSPVTPVHSSWPEINHQVVIRDAAP